MTTHATKEELEAQTQQAIKDAEALKDAPVVEEPESPPEEPKEEPKIVIPQEPEEEEVVTEPPKEPEEEPVVEPELTSEEKLKAEKKKSSASARENQKILAKNRVLNQAVIEAESIPEPTEEELIKEYPDWDVMSEVERGLAKETIVSKRWRAKIKEAGDQASKIEKWNESVEEFADDPKTLVDNPELEGKTDDFKKFATEEANNSVPFNILIGAFLHEQSKDVKHHKGQMFPTGSGGPNTKPTPKSDKLTLEQSRILRETDYTAWKEKLKEGKIDLSV